MTPVKVSLITEPANHRLHVRKLDPSGTSPVDKFETETDCSIMGGKPLEGPLRTLASVVPNLVHLWT